MRRTRHASDPAKHREGVVEQFLRPLIAPFAGLHRRPAQPLPGIASAVVVQQGAAGRRRVAPPHRRLHLPQPGAVESERREQGLHPLRILFQHPLDSRFFHVCHDLQSAYCPRLTMGCRAVAAGSKHAIFVCIVECIMPLSANEMNTSSPKLHRHTGAVSSFIEGLAESGRLTFTIPEVVDKTGLSTIAAASQLLRLGGRVVRVSPRQPFFLIVESSYRPMGAPPVEWWLDAYFRWLRHPYYLALQSAAETYNSAPQAVQITQVITDVPRREISLGRVRIRFFVKCRPERTPVQQPANAYAPIRISTTEATALDLVRYASRIGGMGRVQETLRPLLPSFRVSALRSALDAEDIPAVAQRLGYLLDLEGGDHLAEIVHRWLPSRIARVPLEPSKQPLTETARSRRWRLLVPEGPSS